MSDQRTRHGEPAGDVSLDSKRELGLRATSGRAHRIPKIRGRALEVPAMTAWKRWQDWVVVVLGALLFVSPLVFGETAQTVAASSVYFLGVLVALAGVLNAAMRQAGGLEFIPAVLAVILFVSPWAFGFTAITALAWSAWIIAILIAVALGTLFAMQNRRAMA